MIIYRERQMIEKIKEEFYRTILVNGEYKFRTLQSNKLLKQQINNTPIGDAETYKEKVWMLLNNKWCVPRCVCGNRRKLKNVSEGFREYCSSHCANNSDSKIQKTKANNIERYGVASPIERPNIKAKIEKTNLDRYGVSNVYQSSEIVQRIQDRQRERYMINVLPLRLIELSKFQIFPNGWVPSEYVGAKASYGFIHKECGKTFTARIENGGIPLCPYCHRFRSKIELKLLRELEPLFPHIQKSNRRLINPYEIDMVIDDIGIEVNGIYWHSEDKEQNGKKLPLLEKTLRCPIQLLHFWETELYTRFDVCLSMICAKLGRFTSRIEARKCKVKELSTNEARVFFEINHLQGHVNASLYLGLVFEGEIVQALSVGKSRFNKRYDIELHRLASKLNTQIVGGTERLIAHVRRKLIGKHLISYADKRYSDGAVYKRLGFIEEKDTGPNYFWASRDKIFSRYQCQKHRLSDILEDRFDPNKSEAENMMSNGFYKIRDCGNKVFTIQF